MLIYRSDYDTVDIHTLMRNTVSHFRLFEFKTVVNTKFIFTVHFLIHVVKFDVKGFNTVYPVNKFQLTAKKVKTILILFAINCSLLIFKAYESRV